MSSTMESAAHRRRRRRPCRTSGSTAGSSSGEARAADASGRRRTAGGAAPVAASGGLPRRPSGLRVRPVGRAGTATPAGRNRRRPRRPPTDVSRSSRRSTAPFFLFIHRRQLDRGFAKNEPTVGGTRNSTKTRQTTVKPSKTR